MEEVNQIAEDTGVNDVPAAEVQETQETQVVETSESQVETGVEAKPAAGVEDGTEKAFAARLAKDRQKIEQQHNAILQKAAKVSGFDTVEAYLAAVDEAEKAAEAEAQAKLWQENPTEAAKAAVQRELTAYQERERTIQQQRAELEKKPFYSDIKAEIDQLYTDSAKNGQTLDLDTVYNFVLGQRAPELIANAAKATEKSTVANIQDRARRGVVSQDGSNGEDVDISDIDTGMANAFGNDPKIIAKYVHQQTKRS